MSSSSPLPDALAPPERISGDRFWFLATAILVVGIIARQLWLGEASFHPDEAIHTFFARGFGDYRYDPIYHGPLLYHLVAATFGLFGQNDISARLVPSLLGIGLLALIIGPFRTLVGNRAALAGAALIAVSPSIVTYSRRLLHDSLVLFLTTGAMLCFLSALQNPADTERGRGARIGLFAFLSLFLATKANFFFILALIIAFWIAHRLVGHLRLHAARLRPIPLALFILTAALAIAFPRDNTSAAALQTSQHRVFQIGALAACVLFGLWLLTAAKSAKIAPVEDDDALENRVALAAPRPAFIDLLTTYFLALAGALWLYFFLFGNGAQVISQWAQNGSFPLDTARDGVVSARNAIPKMLEYWGGQQAKPRLPGRHDYYLVLALLYEIPILIAAIGGIWHASKNRSTLTDLLLWWSFSSFAVYAVANEKVPWLIVHTLLPLALLGGIWIGHIRWGKSNLVAATLAGLLFCGRGVSGVNFERGGDHVEPLLYAQTPEMFRDAVTMALHQTRGDNRPMWMAGDRQWPTVWYLRPNAPDVGTSTPIIAGFPTPETYRIAVGEERDWPLFLKAGWKGATVDFLVWPRASWTAMEPKRYIRWFWTRDALPQSERNLPQSEWKLSILGGKGEWSHATAVVGHP